MKSNDTNLADRLRLCLTPAGRYWLLACAAFAAIGIYKGINLILLLAYFLLVLMGINWWHVRRTLNLVSVRVDAIDDGFAGESRRCRCHVGLTGTRRLRGTQVVFTTAKQTCQWYVPLLERGNDISLSRMIVLTERGIFANGLLTLVNSFPFGLVAASREIRDDRVFAIYPERGVIDLGRMLRRQSHDAAERGIHRTAVRQLTEGTDIHGLRPFRPGDSPRWIHWRTTARVGELMVREFDRASGPSLTAIVWPATNESEFESGLTMAATLVWEWTRRQEGRLRLWIMPGENWETWELDHRRRAEDFLRRMAAARYVSSDRRAVVPAELPTRGPIVYIGSRPRDVAETALVFNADWIDPAKDGEIYRPPTNKK